MKLSNKNTIIKPSLPRTMTTQRPRKILEITIISAQDLPPVSKTLRTFAVAYIHPDQKLTTRVDHKGHTNPKWNYKFVFHVDDNFLKSESSTVMLEIYNVAWLRDLPIGNAPLLISNISPPLLQNNTVTRRVALQIRRPSGHLQGALNVGIHLIDNSMPSESPTSDLSISRISTDDEKFQENIACIEKNSQNTPPKNETSSDSDSFFPQRITLKRSGTRKTATSYNSLMRPLPSEVMSDMRKAIYTGEGAELGSSIFENWSDGNGDITLMTKSSAEWPMSVKTVEWPIGDDVPLKMCSSNKPVYGPKVRPRRRGLLSCFGNAYGFQFSFICGSKKMNRGKYNFHYL